jgi:hypothetical protein
MVSGASDVSVAPGSTDSYSDQTELFAMDDQGEAGGDVVSCPDLSQQGVVAEPPGADGSIIGEAPSSSEMTPAVQESGGLCSLYRTRRARPGPLMRSMLPGRSSAAWATAR